MTNPFFAVLPTTGLLVATQKVYSKRAGKHLFVKRHVTSQDDLDTFCRLADQQQTDTWFSVSSFKHSAMDYTARNADVSRVLCHDIDIDAHHPGKYNSQTEAYKAIGGLIASRLVPKPTFFVSSGNGLHVHWALEEDIDLGLRLSLSERLLQALKADPKLCADTSRILDPVSLMRWPGTHNFKDAANPKRVSVIREGFTFSVAEIDAALPKLTRAPLVRKIKPLVKGAEPAYLGDPHVVETRCAAVRYYLENKDVHGDGYDKWFKIMSLTPHLLNGEKTAHKWSQGPNYDQEAVSRTYASIAEDHAAQDRIGASCDTLLAEFGLDKGKVCGGCPRAQSNSCPIFLGRDYHPFKFSVPSKIVDESIFYRQQTALPEHMVNASVGEDGNVKYQGVLQSAGFNVFSNGEVQGMAVHVGSDASEESAQLIATDVPLFDRPWWIVNSYDAVHMGTTQKRYTVGVADYDQTDLDKLGLPKVRVRHVVIPAASVAAGAKLADALKNMGVRDTCTLGAKDRMAMHRKYIFHIENYGGAGLDTLRGAGWTSEGDFILGKARITKEGALPVMADAGYDGICDEVFGVKGELIKCQQVMDLYSAHLTDVGKFTMMLGFAAPLMKFTSDSNVIASLVGGTGVGKSSMQRAIAWLYGRPVASHITADDTPQSRFAVLGALGCCPTMFEEATALGSLADNIVFEFTNGRTKRRLNGSGAMAAATSRWRTIMVTSSNAPLLNSYRVDQSNDEYGAMVARLIEIPVKQAAVRDAAVCNTLNALMTENYGRIGVLYLRGLVQNYESLQRRVTHEELRFKGALKTDEQARKARFKTSMFGAMAVAAEIVNEMGIFQVDSKMLDAMCLALLADGDIADVERAPSPIGFSAGILNNLMRNTREEDFRSNIMRVARVPSENDPVLVCKRVYKTHTNIHVSYRAFIEALSRHGIKPHKFDSVIESLKADGSIIKTGKGRASAERLAPHNSPERTIVFREAADEVTT
jgi:Domain of unknown function (DUF927)